MEHLLPALPYAAESLQPFLSPETLGFHHGKHHQTYVANLNKLIPGTAFENMSLEEIIMKSEGPVFNNAAQVWNHTFYWNCISPGGGQQPGAEMTELINKSFGSQQTFHDKFAEAAAGLFGAGWAWLAMNKEGFLEIVKESNAGNPMTRGLLPLLTCDVWEHAYYIDYRNRRPDYIGEFMKHINWNFVASQLK